MEWNGGALVTSPVERPRCEQCEKYRARIHELAADYDHRLYQVEKALVNVQAERDALIRALGMANHPLAVATTIGTVPIYKAVDIREAIDPRPVSRETKP